MERLAERLDLDQPRFDQSTFIGRLKHFTLVTSPFNAFASNDQLEHAKTLIQQYRSDVVCFHNIKLFLLKLPFLYLKLPFLTIFLLSQTFVLS